MQLGDDLIHFSGGVSPAGGRVDIAHCSEMQNDDGSRFVIRGFEDQHPIVITQGPICVVSRCVESIDDLLLESAGNNHAFQLSRCQFEGEDFFVLLRT